MADIAEISDAKKRSIIFWAESGVLLANPATSRAGSGTHRLFSEREALIASVVAVIAKMGVTVGKLIDIALALRIAYPSTENEMRKFLDERLASGGDLSLVLNQNWHVIFQGNLTSGLPGDGDEDVRVIINIKRFMQRVKDHRQK